MNKEIIKGIVRHALTAAGAGYCTNGVMTNDELSQIVGGVVALIGVIWSVLQKRGAARAVAPILLACLLPLAPMVMTGCNEPPERIAYQTVGSIGATATLAHDAWKAYAATGKASAKDQAMVAVLWNKYCAAYSVACDAGQTISEAKGKTAWETALLALRNCEADLIAAVKQFLPAEEAAKLNGGN
jgi:hypothetical protein